MLKYENSLSVKVGVIFISHFGGHQLTLFLDFDGVLHPEYCNPSLHFVMLPALEALLREYPQVEIVLSSTWRMQFEFSHLLSRFSPDISARIAGQTPVFAELKDVPDRLIGYPRHAECWAWQRDHRMASDNWVALDDRPWLFYPLCHQLIQTNGAIGLTQDDLKRLSTRLGEKVS